jgi:hypothetical protein
MSTTISLSRYGKLKACFNEKQKELREQEKKFFRLEGRFIDNLIFKYSF